MITLRTLLLAGLLAPVASIAQEPSTVAPPDLPSCKIRWQVSARDAGISAQLIQSIIPNLNYLPRVLELDRRQPEFTSTLGGYLSRRLTEKRIEQGRELRQEHARLLDDLSFHYGVPQNVLMAFWGLETNYGGYLGNLPTLDALATLGCDERRSAYFSQELIAALGLIDKHNLNPANMRGSWAGAMGHTQFMPSNYARYGQDGNDDGIVDLWNQRDALTSAAYFLKELGWNAGQRWGREVKLPAGFDYSQAGIKNKVPLKTWQQLGLRNANGGPLPVADFSAALLVPAGHRGPAFLVYDNFRVIMRWNNSQSYALSVGLLSDLIAGGDGLITPAPADDGRIARAKVLQLQQALNQAGFDAGKPDGIAGSGTRAAIRAFQKSRNMIADGFHSQEVFNALGVDLHADN